MKIKKTFIIAEAGVNHNGSLSRSLKMVDVAKNSGADAIKFQTFDASAGIEAMRVNSDNLRAMTPRILEVKKNIIWTKVLLLKSIQIFVSLQHIQM